LPVWKLTIEYEGTRYYGWQEQKNARTVAGELRTAAEQFFNERVELSGAGRTDAGVHALAQVARLKTSRSARPIDLMHALNDRLPPDINVLKIEETRVSFDPRRDAVGRSYLYQIATRRTAFGKRLVWWVKDRLAFEHMRLAAEAAVGRHDFRLFCEKRDDDYSSIVVVKNFELRVDAELLLFRITASHFLWKMVRRVVGSLVEVGRGKLSVRAFQQLVNAEAVGFEVAAHTAPPSGLFLERVSYDEGGVDDEIAPVLSVRRP
jgi:tRNA pseudouridine38-40 synthase